MKGIKVILLLIILALSGTEKIYAQEDTALNNALEKMVKANLTQNAAELIKYTSPRLVKAMGGKEKAIKLLKQSFSTQTTDIAKLDSVINYNKLNVAKLGSINYKFIPQIIIMRMPGKDNMVIGITNLMAIKENASSAWKFMDINDFDEAKLNYLLPEFKNKISFPKKLAEMPLVIPKEELQPSLQMLLNALDGALNKASAEQVTIQ